jgi:methylenetetrahydrofolate dehydrogenase (NADP+) / methenyltetrahydrofolate cyclohydrolase
MNSNAVIINGTAIAAGIRADVTRGVKEWIAAGNTQPGLATVLVGDNSASQAYIKSKQKACQEVGIASFGYDLPVTSTQSEVEELVAHLNSDPSVHGILVQLPLPGNYDEESILKTISIEKDVDGFHPQNIGRLALKGRTPLFIPCTPAGIMVLLKTVTPKLEGLHAVVLGRSNIVGMPTALLLLRANATVTICHSYTRDLKSIVLQADVLVTAIGKPEIVRGEWVKPGAIIIDVGMNRIPDQSRPRGYRLVGDVAFDEVKEKAGAITPVPGGVGPMTVAMLLHNTLHAAQLTEK